MTDVKTNLPSPIDSEMVAILERMVEQNQDITARAVIREHSSLKAASSITRSKERSELILQYQNKQNEQRAWQKRLGKTSKENAAKELAEKDMRIAALTQQVEILTASHVAMIRAIGELGGFSKWAKFFQDYQPIRDRLNTIGAMPSTNALYNLGDGKEK